MSLGADSADAGPAPLCCQKNSVLASVNLSAVINSTQKKKTFKGTRELTLHTE